MIVKLDKDTLPHEGQRVRFREYPYDTFPWKVGEYWEEAGFMEDDGWEWDVNHISEWEPLPDV